MTTMDDIWLDVMQQQNCCMDHGCLKFKYQLQCIDRTNKWWNVFFLAMHYVHVCHWMLFFSSHLPLKLNSDLISLMSYGKPRIALYCDRIWMATK